MNYLLVAVAMTIGADTGSEVRSIFAQKCVGCHGEKVAKPKGGFGFVLDLKRVAANREIVVPGDLKHSNLWLLVQASNMPPNDSPTGPLSAVQKNMVKAWIEAGCPAPVAKEAPAVSEPPVGPVKEPVEKPPVPPAATAVPGQTDDSPGEPLVVAPGRLGASFLTRTVDWVGNFHLLILHFPIALVMIATLGEGLAWWVMRAATPERMIVGTLTRLGVGSLIAVAAIMAVPTVALGWLHANSGAGAAQLDNLFWHQWLGTGVLVLLGGTAWLCWGDARTGTRRLATTAMILGSAGLMGLVGHFGGMMVHGRNFLSW